MSSQIRNFRPGQYLFKEGDPSRCLYLIKKGSVAVRKMKQGGYIELARIYSNEVLGELSFFDRLPRSASAVALTEVEALEITFDSLDQVYTKVPDYLKTIIAAVAERLRRANDTIRRLQKNLVTEGGAEVGGATEAEDIAAIFAKTENMVMQSQAQADTGNDSAASTNETDQKKGKEDT